MSKILEKGVTGSILVVDDDPSVRELLKDLLLMSDYDVVACESPFEALDLVKNHSFDLVITDLMMPGMSGMDLVKALKDHDPALPVIMVTAYPTLDTAVGVMKEGAYDFITKPFEMNRIRFVVRRAIEEGRFKREYRELLGRVKEVDRIKHVVRDLEKKTKELSAFYTISEALYYPFTIRDLLKKVSELATVLTESKVCGIWTLEDDRLTLKASKGLEGVEHAPVDEGIRAKIFGEKRPLILKDCHGCPCGKGGEGHPFLGVPILIGGDVFAFVHLCQKMGGGEYSQTDLTVLKELCDKASLRLENIALYENLLENLRRSIASLVRAIDARDNYTMNHCRRTTLYAIHLARFIGCSLDVIDAFRFAGPLHDVGKIGIRDAILLKPERLTKEEFEIMKSHPMIGEDIVGILSLGELETAIVRNHHERFDGRGYPDGLGGKDIPLVARIFAVVDTYDAMTTTRPYRPARTHEEAIAELIRCSGSQFDREIVEAFIDSGMNKGSIKEMEDDQG